MGIQVRFHHITKKYGNNTVVNDAHFDVEAGEFFTLLGPSGCGKTTLLRMAAGFNSIEGGEIFFGSRRINDEPAHLRNIGMVFQSYAIFPHLTVAENVAYGLKARRLPAHQIAKEIREAMELVQIGPFADRMPTQMSGGQQQRIALARAIVIKPDLLLMDEPLSNLDAKLRVQMRIMIKRLQQKLGITTIYVTHDQEEALAVSDRIAVMKDGVIQQIDTPSRIYNQPANSFVSSFIGTTNFLKGTIEAPGADAGSYTLHLGSRCSVPLPKAGRAFANGAEVLVSVRPDCFSLEGAKERALHGHIDYVDTLGNITQYFITLDDGQAVEFWQYQIQANGSLDSGASVTLHLNPRFLSVFDPSDAVLAGEAAK